MKPRDIQIAEIVVKRVMAQLEREVSLQREITVNISARHVHLSKDHLELLFGKGSSLTPLRELMQPGEYAANQTVMAVGPRGAIENIRVLGPLRAKTQVEISKTDGYSLGINPPVRESGNHTDTPGCILVGPMGAVKLEDGVICALRHIHMPEDIAKTWGIAHNQTVKVSTKGERRVIFDNVLVRVSPNFALEMHVDTDEANASGISNSDTVFLVD